MTKRKVRLADFLAQANERRVGPRQEDMLAFARELEVEAADYDADGVMLFGVVDDSGEELEPVLLFQDGRWDDTHL